MSREERVKYLKQLIIPNLFDNSLESSELRIKQETALRETIEELEQQTKRSKRYCDDCLHKNVCGLEGTNEEAMTYCADKLEVMS